MNRISLLFFAAVLLTPHVVLAQSLVRADGSTDVGPWVSVEHGPQAIRHGGTPVTLTHSASQDIVSATGVACPTPPNSYFRVFDLADFSLTGDFEVSSVDIGIEVGADGATVVNLYTLDGAFTLANLTLVSTAPLAVTSADGGTIVNAPITGTLAMDDVLVVEWAVPQTGVFFGGNSAGQTGPTYIAAAACGATEPADVATLGFPDAHWVLNVNGDDLGATANEAGSELPSSVTLGQSYPNPFRAGATVPFTVNEASDVRLAVYDVLGREVAVLADRAYAAGAHAVSFDARSLPSGTFVYRLEANGEVQMQTVTLLK